MERNAVGLIEAAPEFVGGSKNQIDRLLSENELAGAREIEHVFGLMGQFLDSIRAEKSGEALDRMKRPEDPVQRLGIPGILLERENSGFHGHQMLAGFHQKFLNQFGVV